jgi:hypothetical protein
MIYQNPYQNIRTADIYGARKQAAQDQLAEQQKQLALQQKARLEKQEIAKNLYDSANRFSQLSDDKQAAAWQTYRSKWVAYMPEANSVLPNVWDSKDPVNKDELNTFINFISDFVPEETISIAQGGKIIGLRGNQARTIAENPKTEEEYDKLVDLQTVDLETGQPIEKTVRRRKNDEGFWQSGNLIFPEGYEEGVDKEVYYTKMGIVPKSKSASVGASIQQSRPSVNSLATPPAAPMAIPGQTELPPRQFNAPSPTNRAGETNVGFPIDENAMMQQQQIMPTMGNSMLRGAGAVMADEFAPQPRNALVGGMMPQPSQFAELMPAGSTPNRFGSPGVEGIDFAATGGQGPVDARGIPLSAIGSARPRFVATDKGQIKEVFRPMTPEEVKKEGQDPTRITGRVSQFGVIQWQPKTTPAQLQKEGAEAKAAEATAAQNQAAVRRARTDIVSFLRGVRRYRSVLNKIGQQSFVDTGPFDTLIVENTQLGSELNGLGDTVGEELKSAMKVAGDPKTADELKEMVNQLPNTRRRFPQNIKNLNFREEYFLDRIGVQTSVANDAEFDALTPGTVFVDLNDGGIYRKMKAKE